MTVLSNAEGRALLAQHGKKGKKAANAPPVESKPPDPTHDKAKSSASNQEPKIKQVYPDADVPRAWGGESPQFGFWLKHTGLSETQFNHLRAYAHQYLNLP